VRSSFPPAQSGALIILSLYISDPPGCPYRI
jgi:hypothetical protein